MGVLTLPLSLNYGGNLQAFALVEALRQLGHQTVLINRKHPYKDYVENPEAASKDVKRHLIAESIGFSKTTPNRSFIDENISPISRVFYESEQLAANIENFHFDAVIVGSDQVWRPKYANKIFRNFFLDFIPENSNTKKISYAASFGADQWEFNIAQTRDASRLAQDFDAISVREDSAVSFCWAHLGVKAEQVLDPTLLLLPERYTRLFSSKQRPVHDNSLLTYVLDQNPDKAHLIDTVSAKLGLSAYATNGLPFAPSHESDQHEGDKTVENWLGSFHDARFVVTDSFHGVAFSILFNKPFIAYGNPERGMARFQSILKLFDLEDRLVTSSDEINFDTVFEPIDWTAINQKLEKLRAQSFDFLKAALRGGKSESVPPALAQALVPGNTPEKAVDLQGRHPLNTLCTGCGVCVSEAGNALKMAWNQDGFLEPVAVSGSVPPEAVRVCPFNTQPEKEVEDEDALARIFLPSARNLDPKAGKFESAYIGYSKKFRETSSSGGLATYVFEKLLERGDVDYLFVVQSDGDSGYKYKIHRKTDDISAISKTRYFPVSLDELFAVIDRTEGSVAVSGVACFIKAIRLKQYYHPEYREKIPFLAGIMCGGLKSRFYTDFLAQSAQIQGKFSNPEYRVKNPDSTALDYSFSAVDDQSQLRSVRMQRVGDMWGTGLFKAKACDFCTDVLTELADISLGDAWLPKYKPDGMGNSVIITRTPLAEEIIRFGIEAGELVLDPAPIQHVINSQGGGFNHKHNGVKFRAWMTRYFSNQPVPAVRGRILKGISITEAIIQIHRERTRYKSLRYWKETRNAQAFKKRMRSSLKSLKTVTEARKNGSNTALISLLSMRKLGAPSPTKGDRPPPNTMTRWLLRHVGGRQSSFGLLRAAIFDSKAVLEQDATKESKG
ncbi:polysaccharide pyruvyl transferase family protein [Ruegeria pomeroyi]|nr:polysaccharide pyruvyl transferase family protein [Ruegeria pomeroyi]